ncbi:TRAP transporter large permease subunit [Marinobacter sp. KMM 10035]|uniref:TRAP transporter large permease subunit n=1 Tax=Marinobacter sp. KMM 10035 TaxID=3134034 RepID=UPI00397B2470
MPFALMLMLSLIAFVAVLFIFFKRPMYEIMALSLLGIVAVTGQWSSFFDYLIFPANSSLFFTIFAFLALAAIFDATHAVSKIVNILLALVGKFSGGAGYVALAASAFMASLSGTGPGNVAASGVFTIPLMKKSGFTPHLAATTEMSASMLGNVIPPAGIIFLTFGIYDSFAPGNLTLGSWLIASYLVGLWFILQRILTLMILCKIENVKPIPKEDIPSFKESFRDGWHALLLPVFIFIPLFLSALPDHILISRLGVDGAVYFSKSVMMFTPGIAAAYAILISKKGDTVFGVNEIMIILRTALPNIVPVAATIYLAYSLSQAFLGMGANDEIQSWFVSLDLSVGALVIILPLFFCILGMVLPGSAQVAILGGSMISVFGALGGDPLQLAIMLPAMTGAMEGMTPPLALGLFVAMGIAKSDFIMTCKLALVWIASHLLMTMILVAGILPIIFL